MPDDRRVKMAAIESAIFPDTWCVSTWETELDRLQVVTCRGEDRVRLIGPGAVLNFHLRSSDHGSGSKVIALKISQEPMSKVDQELVGFNVTGDTKACFGDAYSSLRCEGLDRWSFPVLPLEGSMKGPRSWT